MVRKKEKIISKTKKLSKVKQNQQEARRRVEIKRDFRRAFKREHDLKIKSIKESSRYGVTIWEIKAENDSEWVGVRDYETMDELATADIKNMLEWEGLDAIGGLNNWVVSDNFDRDKALEDFDEIIQMDVDEGVFKDYSEAKEHYKDVLDDPSERSIYINKSNYEKYIDYDKVAEDIVRHDGASNSLARYDGRTHETPEEDFVYWREN
jgi:hypothetical protein